MMGIDKYIEEAKAILSLENVEITDKAPLIIELKKILSLTDYQAIKYSEGWISESDYSSTKAKRQKIREIINKLESEG